MTTNETPSRARWRDGQTRARSLARIAGTRRRAPTRAVARRVVARASRGARDAVNELSHHTRTGRTLKAKELACAMWPDVKANDVMASMCVDAVARGGDVGRARAMMGEHRTAVEANGGVTCGTLCAWARVEEAYGGDDGDKRARALYKEATGEERERANASAEEDRATCEGVISFGKFELARGRIDKAEKLFKRAIETFRERAPASASVAAHSIGGLEARRNNATAAREAFALAVELCPTHVANYTSWGMFEISRGRSEDARGLFRRGADAILASERDSSRQKGGREERRQKAMESALYTAWGALEGQMALQTARSDENGEASPAQARELFARACEASPKNVASWLQWSALEEDIARGSSHQGGIVIARRGVSNRQQLDVLHAGLKANPGEMRLEHARAMALKLNGDVEGATKALLRLSERFPKSSHVWHALGTTLQESGDFKGAIEAFERGAFASGQANLACVTAAAAAEFHGGQHGRARQLFMQGDSIPRHLSTRRERAAHLRLWALLEKRVGSEEAARRLFIAATKEDRTDAATWLQWGQWEKRVNSIDAARKVFSDGVKFGVNNGQYFVYQALATLEAEAERGDTARELFKQGCSAHPRSASLWLQWALFELSRDDAEHVTRAIRVIEQGLARAPPHTPLLELLLDLERERGNAEAAEEVQARLTRLMSEQRYSGSVGREVRA